MKHLIIIIGTTLLGCYIFGMMIGSGNTLEMALRTLLISAARSYG